MAGKPPPDMRIMRLPVQIEGTWRKTVRHDNDGWQSHSYELVAAQWIIVDAKGNPMQFGNPPILSNAAALR